MARHGGEIDGWWLKHTARCDTHPTAGPIACLVALLTQDLGVIPISLVVPIGARVTQVTGVSRVAGTLPTALPCPCTLVDVEALVLQ